MNYSHKNQGDLLRLLSDIKLQKENTFKILINTNFGGYKLSKEAYIELGIEWDGSGSAFKENRGNPRLIEVAEKLGSKISYDEGDLVIEELTLNDVLTGYLKNYDGSESIVYSYSYYNDAIIDII